VRGLRCYITDRRAVSDFAAAVRRNVAAGVDYIQIREKDLEGRALAELTRGILTLTQGSATRVLVNDRLDVALACGAQGVHLRGSSLAPTLWRRITPPGFVIGVSCHSLDDLLRADGADFALFGPVFDSAKGKGIGLEALAQACHSTRLPVLALGGVRFEMEAACLRAGAAGIAGIRLFQI
jgi:thiamine-phosphate pyrophosphorylase